MKRMGLLILFLFPSLLCAQDTPDAHPFWDQQNLYLHVPTLPLNPLTPIRPSASSNAEPRARMNPLARPFVTQGWKGQAALQLRAGLRPAAWLELHRSPQAVASPGAYDSPRLGHAHRRRSRTQFPLLGFPNLLVRGESRERLAGYSATKSAILRARGSLPPTPSRFIIKAAATRLAGTRKISVLTRCCPPPCEISFRPFRSEILHPNP